MKLNNRQHTHLAAILLYGSIAGALIMAALQGLGLISHYFVDLTTNYLSWLALWYAGYVAYRQETLRDRGKS